MEDSKSLINIIENYVESDNLKLPVFNSIAMRVQNEISKEEPNLDLIEKLIISDQALTGSLLKVSNSNFFKGFSEVSTVRQAIVRLGINEVANIVTMTTHKNNFHSKDPFVQGNMRKLWQHSVGCALSASWIAKNISLTGIASEAFFAALLHDVGKLLILKVIDEIKLSGKLLTFISDEVLAGAMSNLHTNFGHMLMKKWNCPEKYARVAMDHHLEDIKPNDYIIILVRLANNVCNKLGYGINLDSSIVLAATTEAELLNLSEINLAELEIKLEDSRLLD